MAARKVLIIDTDVTRTEALTSALSRGGLVVTTAPDGFYALTAVERDRPELVLICGGGSAGIDPVETCAILRADPSLAGVKVGYYLADADGEDTLADLYDLTIFGPIAPSLVASKVKRYLSHQPAVQLRSVDQEGEGMPVDPTRNALSGSLEVLNLVELIQVLCQSQQRGRLCILFGGELAEVCIDDARVVHSAYQGRAGRDAMVATLAAGQAETNAEFWFEAMSREETFRFPRTINMSVQQLLLSIAVDFDESTEHSSERGA